MDMIRFQCLLILSTEYTDYWGFVRKKSKKRKMWVLRRQSHFFEKKATVFVCLFYYVTIIIIFWFCLVGFVLSALNYAKEVSIIFCFRMNFWDLYRIWKENTSGIMRIRFQLQVSKNDDKHADRKRGRETLGPLKRPILIGHLGLRWLEEHRYF